MEIIAYMAMALVYLAVGGFSGMMLHEATGKVLPPRWRALIVAFWPIVWVWLILEVPRDYIKRGHG